MSWLSDGHHVVAGVMAQWPWSICVADHKCDESAAARFRYILWLYRLKNAMSLSGPQKANLVFTLDRKGHAFAKFFHALFDRMRGGENLLEAWVELAPQAALN
jgi:hypothetical protein